MRWKITIHLARLLTQTEADVIHLHLQDQIQAGIHAEELTPGRQAAFLYTTELEASQLESIVAKIRGIMESLQIPGVLTVDISAHSLGG